MRRLLFGLLLAESVAAGTVPAIQVIAPRDFGHVIGEIIHHDIQVRLASEYSLEPSFLPQAGSALNDWLEVRQISWDRKQQDQQQVYHIAIDYQVFKGVREPEAVTIPSLPLHFRKGDESLVSEVPAWPFTLNPLISPKLKDGEVSIRSDLPPPDLLWNSHAAGFAVALTLLLGGCVFAAWQRGWLPFRARRMLPFERAWHDLRRLQRQPLTAERLADEFRVVHTALNETFGATVFAGQIVWRVVDEPKWMRQQAALEQFFTYSEQLFFSPQAAQPSQHLRSWLKEFCRQCRQIESLRR